MTVITNAAKLIKINAEQYKGLGTRVEAKELGIYLKFSCMNYLCDPHLQVGIKQNIHLNSLLWSFNKSISQWNFNKC